MPSCRLLEKRVHQGTIAPLTASRMMQRRELHPAGDGGIGSRVDQNSRHIQRTVSRHLAKRCITEARFITGINLSPTFKEPPHHREVRSLGRVVEWRLSEVVKSVWVGAGIKQRRHGVYIAAHGGEVKLVGFRTTFHTAPAKAIRCPSLVRPTICQSAAARKRCEMQCRLGRCTAHHGDDILSGGWVGYFPATDCPSSG